MNRGFYRWYFHIGGFGFKFARINFNDANPFVGFLTACIMNILERKRYKYYCCGKSYRQWGRKWKYDGERPIFCPTYFSCGIFNIVKHLPMSAVYDDLVWFAHINRKDKRRRIKTRDDVEVVINRKTVWMCCNDIKPENFRFDDDCVLYAIDYGDFTLGNMHAQCACLIDYK